MPGAKDRRVGLGVVVAVDAPTLRTAFAPARGVFPAAAVSGVEVEPVDSRCLHGLGHSPRPFPMHIQERPAEVLLVHPMVHAAALAWVVLVAGVRANLGLRLLHEMDAPRSGVVANLPKEWVLTFAASCQVGGVGPGQVHLVAQHVVHILFLFTHEAGADRRNVRGALLGGRLQLPADPDVGWRPTDLTPREVRPVLDASRTDDSPAIGQFGPIRRVQQIAQRHRRVERALRVVSCQNHHQLALTPMSGDPVALRLCRDRHRIRSGSGGHRGCTRNPDDEHRARCRPKAIHASRQHGQRLSQQPIGQPVVDLASGNLEFGVRTRQHDHPASDRHRGTDKVDLPRRRRDQRGICRRQHREHNHRGGETP